jgi:hypothetical protein
MGGIRVSDGARALRSVSTSFSADGIGGITGSSYMVETTFDQVAAMAADVGHMHGSMIRSIATACRTATDH